MNVMALSQMETIIILRRIDIRSFRGVFWEQSVMIF
jgi:hypothetical protein